MLNSASNVANDLCACGNPIHLFFSKKDMRSAMAFETVKALISSYFEKGGFHLQMSATDGNTLREAQMNPDAYSDCCMKNEKWRYSIVKFCTGSGACGKVDRTVVE
jgi:pyruvate-formate lyase